MMIPYSGLLFSSFGPDCIRHVGYDRPRRCIPVSKFT